MEEGAGRGSLRQPNALDGRAKTESGLGDGKKLCWEAETERWAGRLDFYVSRNSETRI